MGGPAALGLKRRGGEILSRCGNFRVALQRGWCLAGSPVGALGRGKGAWTALSGRTAAGHYTTL